MWVGPETRGIEWRTNSWATKQLTSSRKKTVIFLKAGNSRSYQQLPFQAKKGGEKLKNSHRIMEMFCFVFQSVFRIRGVDSYPENVSRRVWCISTITVWILSTPTCHPSAKKTGVCYKMSSGSETNINKAFCLFLSWNNFLVISEIWSKVFKKGKERKVNWTVL